MVQSQAKEAELISSPHSTFYYKRLFPVAWFTFLALAGVVSLFFTASDTTEKAMVLIGILVLAILGFAYFRAYLWVVMDEVIDNGDSLSLIRNGQEVTIPIDKMFSATASSFVLHHLSVLSLKCESPFGMEVLFFPRSNSWTTFSFRNQTIVELNARIQLTRTEPPTLRSF